MSQPAKLWRGAGVVIDSGSSWVLQRRDNIDGIHWPGKIALWGGAMELVDESNFLKNALRELSEETGLQSQDVDVEHFGSFAYDHQTLEGEPVHNQVELFVARLKKPIAIHVYEGKSTYEINKSVPLSDIDNSDFAPGAFEAIGKLQAYDSYQQNAA